MRHRSAQMRDKFGFEPWILSQPSIVAPGRMRQRYYKWTIFPPVAHRFRDAFLGAAVQMIALSIGSDCQQKSEFWRGGEEPPVPMARAFWARRLVGTHFVISRKAKTHGDDGDAALVIENTALHAEPGTQAGPRGVVIGDAGIVNALAGRLAGDAKPGGLAHPEHRPDALRQLGGADLAGANLANKRVQVWPMPHVFTNEHDRRGDFKRQTPGSIPTTAPVMPEAMVPETSAFRASSTTSWRRAGTMPDTPAIRIPTDPRLAKPHMA